jgi:hypothetical protein
MNRIVVLAVVVSCLAPGGALAAPPVQGAPPQLVGTFQRDVTQAELTRAQAFNGVFPGKWTLKVTEAGEMSFYAPRQRSVFIGGPLAIVAAGKVSLWFGCADANVYRWRASATSVTFVKVKDPCGDRVGVLTGTWKKR